MTASVQSESLQDTRLKQDTPTPFDPLRFCIFTTIAIIAWLVGPPIAVTLMSGLGLWAYVRAWQEGLRKSKCFLHDTRLVIAYLAAAFLSGSFFIVRELLDLAS